VGRWGLEMKILNPSEYGKKYGYTAKVVIKMCNDGILKYEKTEGGHYKICDCNDGMVTLEEYTKLLIEYEKLKEFVSSVRKQAECKLSETRI
jgi:hypothetical protein